MAKQHFFSIFLNILEKPQIEQKRFCEIAAQKKTISKTFQTWLPIEVGAFPSFWRLIAFW
jgi:hypothetical protein